MSNTFPFSLLNQTMWLCPLEILEIVDRRSLSMSKVYPEARSILAHEEGEWTGVVHEDAFYVWLSWMWMGCGGYPGMIGGRSSASYSILKLPLDFCMCLVIMPWNKGSMVSSKYTLSPIAYDHWWRGWILLLNENWGGWGTQIWYPSDGSSWTCGSSWVSRCCMGMNSGVDILLENVDESDV